MHPHEHAPDADRSARTARAPMPAPASAATPAAGLSPHSILALQRSAGNAAVVQMLRQAGHPWAQEQHQHGANCGHQQPAVQRSAVHDVLRGGGQPLDGATRTDMESRLGADFSDVRIHNDSAARASAAEVGASAYTSGNHVVIGDGGADKHTLAHELTHVIQQRRGPVLGTDNGSGLKVSDPSDRFEREAEANATRVVTNGASSPTREAPGASAPSTGGEMAVQRARNNKNTRSNQGQGNGATGGSNQTRATPARSSPFGVLTTAEGTAIRFEKDFTTREAMGVYKAKNKIYKLYARASSVFTNACTSLGTATSQLGFSIGSPQIVEGTLVRDGQSIEVSAIAIDFVEGTFFQYSKPGAEAIFKRAVSELTYPMLSHVYRQLVHAKRLKLSDLQGFVGPSGITFIDVQIRTGNTGFPAEVLLQLIQELTVWQENQSSDALAQYDI